MTDFQLPQRNAKQMFLHKVDNWGASNFAYNKLVSIMLLS